ncbi:MAG TPA: hypothetical protein VGL59_26055 [Polyangia bacterium]
MALFGVLAAGCGDDTPAQPDGGTGGSGTGGSGGHAGDAGMDSKDADAKVDGPEAGDLNNDRGDTGETGDVPTDRGETGETGDVPTDRGETGDVPADGNTDLPVDTSEVARACYMVAFVKPLDQAILTAADDKDADQCADGFQYDVKINSSDAPDGASVNLLAGNVMVGTGTIASGSVTFTSVQLSTGDTQLSIQFPSTMPCSAATTKAKVTVNCNVPACTISKPAHATLNGIPVANGGDRVSADGAPYQAAFEVTTNIDDGRTVALKIDNAATPATVSTVSGTAMSGKATFTGVTLSPDGTYDVVAQCTDKNGIVGSSMKATYVVDNTPPDLTLSKPANGAFIGPSGLTSNQFQVCGQTTATDAVNLPVSLGAGANNFCITGTTNCAHVTAVGTDACVNFTCPGGAPFDISVTLTDAAGNPTIKSITGVACASTLPSVRIVKPISDAPSFNDPSKHILNAAVGNVVGDIDVNTPGAQANVSACTDRSGSAQLFVGHAGDASLVALGAPVATVAAGIAECPSGFAFVARFPSVTLSESTEDASGALTHATELRVDLTDVTTAKGSSTPVDVWVDTVPPAISLMSPANLCGSLQQAVGPFTTDVALTSDTATVVLSVANGASTSTRSNPTFAGGAATFTTVAFDQGQNNLTAVATDPAGNTNTLAPAPCTITVGGSPVVTFTTPLVSNSLCPNGSAVAGCLDDTNTGTAGWQGSITAHATVGGVPLGSTNVTFTIGATTLGTAMLNVNGDATLAITTNIVPEGSAVTFTATTDNVPAHGVGVGTVTVDVDTLPPAPPTGPSGAVVDYRQTSFRMTWTAPGDNGRAITGYQVRAAKVPITAMNFDDATVTKAITFSGTPAPENALDGILIQNLNIEQDYYFAVAAVDGVGSRSTIAATTTATTAHFKTILLSGAGTDGFGFVIEGEGDFGQSAGLSFTGDKISDLVVGGTGGKNVYIFFGKAGGYSTSADVTISGASAGFGSDVIDAGDVDGDGLDDLAIGSPSENKIYIYSRKNPPVSWGTTTSWPATLTDLKANYVITLGGADAGAYFGGGGLARLGNFDGTGTDDFAIGLGFRSGFQGSVLIVKGRSSFPAAITTPDSTNTIEIDGNTNNAFFGYGVMGIGQFYPQPAGPTLIATAPGIGSAFAFPGQAPAGILSVTNAADSTAGDATVTYGVNSGFLGKLGSSPGALTLGAPDGKYVDVHVGTAVTGPFPFDSVNPAPAGILHVVDSFSGVAFGIVNLGTGIRGTSTSVSLIGDSSPDLVLAGQGETNTPVYILSGTSLLSQTGTLNFSDSSSPVQTGLTPGLVKILNAVPWSGYTGGLDSVIPDSNGDGYADFALGENDFGGPGRVVVFY